MNSVSVIFDDTIVIKWNKCGTSKYREYSDSTYVKALLDRLYLNYNGWSGSEFSSLWTQSSTVEYSYSLVEMVCDSDKNNIIWLKNADGLFINTRF